MATNLTLGIDIGTQGVKGALFDARGRILGSAFRPSRLVRGRGGAVEEDPERQLRDTCAIARECVAASRRDARDVAGVGIAGQMAGVIGVDESGRAVTPYDSWLDYRCAPQATEMERRAGALVTQRAGCAPGPNHGPKILWWMQERSRVFRSIASFIQPGGFVAMRLCGLQGAEAFIDDTYLHFSGFADNARARWDKELCSTFSVPLEKLPRIVSPREVVGALTPEMARRCGLAAGTPVVAGCGDTAASFLATGATAPGVCVDVAGTAAVHAATTRRFRPDVATRVLACGRSITPGLWHPYAYIGGGGMNLEWIRRVLSAGAEVDFKSLDRLAARITPALDDPLFVPHMGGRVCPPDAAARGKFHGLHWDHDAAHLYRAVLEATALEYGLYQQILADMGERRPREIRVTGGGSTSRTWNQIKADTLGVPVIPVRHGGGAAMGAALVAAWGVGIVDDIAKSADGWVRVNKAVQPKSTKAFRRARLDQYRQIQPTS